MPPRARIYLHCVVGTGIFLLADGLSQFAPTDVRRFVAYLALALLSGTWKFKVPGISVTFSTTFAFVLIGIANFSLGEALLMGCGATLVQYLWRPTAKRSVRKVFFNVSGVAIGVTVAYNPAHFEMAQGLDKAPGISGWGCGGECDHSGQPIVGVAIGVVHPAAVVPHVLWLLRLPKKPWGAYRSITESQSEAPPRA